MYRIILLGPQGSGKGTQGAVLAKRLNIPLISTGHLLREEIAAKTKLGLKIEALLRGGNLAPNELTAEIIKNRLSKPDAAQGFILDGYPRSRPQYDLLNEFIAPTDVLVLTLSDDEAVKRLSGRLMCPQCGNNYHVVYNPSKVSQGGIWFCEDDKTELIVRDDDKPESVRRRLDIYHNETEPLLKLYRPQGIVHEVEAGGSIEEVQKEVMKLFT